MGEDGQQRPAAEQESVEDLTAGLEESRIFSSRERAALAFARRLVSAPESIDDDAFEALRELGYTDSQIMEILATAGMFVMHATVISALALKSPFDPQN
ncbi:MAG: carboxymuconolactone decarboxylase family protein [Acidobacteriota bacterium]